MRGHGQEAPAAAAAFAQQGLAHHHGVPRQGEGAGGLAAGRACP